MQRIILAFRAFFKILLGGLPVDQAQRLLAAPATEAAATPASAENKPAEPKPAAEPARPAAARSDALHLLSALQREARFVDFIQEPIAGYSDAQIGAAVRNIHRDCAALLARLFDLAPIEKAAEGAEIEVPAGFDPARTRLIGNVGGQPPLHGRLCHHGWQAQRCELPEWTGSERSVLVVAPAEIEIK